MDTIIVKSNRYVDSVSLMAVGDRLKGLHNIQTAEVQMATPANRELLEEEGFSLPEGLTPNDLVIAVRSETKDQADAAVKLAEDLLDHKASGEEGPVYHSLREIDLAEDSYDLVQISLPGEYAAAEAREALRKGLDVFIFSDNVSLDEELELKKLGEETGRLVMGPDCGVGLIGGVALAAGSIIASGPVGIVGASGSGAQEVACIIERCGYGISTLIGTGGRDLYPEIGGISMLRGMRRLEENPDTRVIVLVSKLADRDVMEKILAAADSLSKPVAAVFLGGDEKLFAGHRTKGAFSLEEAALTAIRLLGETPPVLGLSDAELEKLADKELALLDPGQKYFRSLYCGGTFTEEGLICFSRTNPSVELYTNLRNRYAKQLPDHRKSQGNTILDLGAEDFTADAPHPVFEPALRLKRFYEELEDPEVAVILLDFITGPGVHPDPITPFVRAYEEKVLARGKKLVVISSICGSREDPQNVEEKAKLLRKAGVLVMPSNYQSARLAGLMMRKLAERG
ncbi:MAG TPA: FdrA family protein [Candidatus Merdivicinus faecavium]|nr:FdrA family protein [Candidatus Merdivicinus faecavium]